MQDPNNSTLLADEELGANLGARSAQSCGKVVTSRRCLQQDSRNRMRPMLWRGTASSVQDIDTFCRSAQHTSYCSTSPLEYGGTPPNTCAGAVYSSGGSGTPSAQQQSTPDNSQQTRSSSSIMYSEGASTCQHISEHDQHKRLPHRKNPHSLYSRAMSQSFLAVLLCTLLLGMPIQAARTIEASVLDPQV